ncbi:MAG: hypothetical protein DMF88_26145 [Acidobacteria bacterium]|nr:MAG: hypothetical protein DMF88_26145 [Acidobacteriota bacterium]
MAGDNGTGTNLSYTKFLFVIVRRNDEAALAKLRAAGGQMARGYFNDYDADGTRELQPHERIQFLVADGDHHADSGIAAAQYVVQVSGKYRPRLDEFEAEFRRRVGDIGDVIAINGAERAPRYTSAELYDFAYRRASQRKSGRVARNAIILPISKSGEWWKKPSLERHTYFYPHVDAGTGCPVHGHAQTAQDGIATLYRRLYHNPDGYERAGEFDFITYFECEDAHTTTFERVHQALRDITRNPEWLYVEEGPLWRGRRVLKW